MVTCCRRRGHGRMPFGAFGTDAASAALDDPEAAFPILESVHGASCGRNAARPGEYYAFAEASGPFFACLPSAVVEPRLSAQGAASAGHCAPSTLPEMLSHAAAKGEKPALKVERPLPPLGEDGIVPPALADEDWLTWSYAEYLAEVRVIAKGFVNLGFQPFDTLNIWGFNSPEWMIGALAANFAGGKVAGLYPTDTGDIAAYKVAHSGGCIVLVEDRGKLDRLLKALDERGDAKRVRAFVAWGFELGQTYHFAAGEQLALAGCGQVPLISWKTLLTLGNSLSNDEIEARVEEIQPGTCAAIIYTSGTTGEPKGVMISHDSIIFEAASIGDMLAKAVGLGMDAAQERILSYLPLSHVAGMLVDIVCPIVLGVRRPGWGTIYFARNYDIKAGSLKDRLKVAEPTVFLGVPLVWEKIADKIRAIGASNTGIKKSLGDSAKSICLHASRTKQAGGDGSTLMGHSLATMLMGRVKQELGLHKCKFGFTGAAPIRMDTLEYFGSLGLQIYEVYGMSECTGACTMSLPQYYRWGSCGWEIPGVEVKCFQVDEVDMNTKTECPLAETFDETREEFQGELCFRGRNIMMGYLANPDFGEAHISEIERKTREAIDDQGWLHSGDKGLITKDGFVKITGRYKELIIGEGGENIAPVPIEDCVKKACDGISEVMMIGDKRKYNVALVTLKAVGANGESPGTDQLDAGAKRVNPDVSTISAAMKDEKWIDAVRQAIYTANNNGKICPNNTFKIQKFTILPTNFSEEKSELTPTKKLKRKVVEELHAETIGRLYTTEGVYIPYLC